MSKSQNDADAILANGQERLRVIYRGHYIYWEIKCFCGDIRITHKWNAIRSKSCGCLTGELTRAKNSTHGMTKTSTYRVWSGIRTRCYNLKSTHYKSYGGRGIEMCDRWKESFANFLADMGEKPDGKEIDRRNNDGHYSPENCRWATRLEQANNTTKNVLLSYDGKTMTIREWERVLGMKRSTVNARIARGWTSERALTEGPRRDARWHD